MKKNTKDMSSYPYPEFFLPKYLNVIESKLWVDLD